jgi:hypothetical protein
VAPRASFWKRVSAGADRLESLRWIAHAAAAAELGTDVVAQL